MIMYNVQGDLIEQTEKLESLLLYTIENCWRKHQAWVHFVNSQ
jgi:hypothetical protein